MAKRKKAVVRIIGKPETLEDFMQILEEAYEVYMEHVFKGEDVYEIKGQGNDLLQDIADQREALWDYIDVIFKHLIFHHSDNADYDDCGCSITAVEADPVEWLNNECGDNSIYSLLEKIKDVWAEREENL